MSSIDERVVQMKFDNKQFEAGVKQTTSSLDALKKGLNLTDAQKGLEDLDDAGKRFSLAGIGAGVQAIADKFNALAVIGVTALATITTQAVNAGIQLTKSLTIAPITAGLKEYETNLNAIQTILANTQSKGTELDDVNLALQELNEYSDKTIYNFSEMARNIGTFTAAGVDLDSATSAIKGIANLAAVSGSNSQQASTAMYQLSQALSSGTVKLMDWNSVVNAGMGGQLFQDALKETARNQGVAIDEIIKKNGSFRDSLQEGWLTSGILTETLSKLTGDLTNEQLKAMGYTEEQIVGIQKMARTASDAATKVKTYTQLIQTLQEAAGSGWSQTWQLILGDFEEAKALFTGINDVLGGVINASSDARNEMLQQWKDAGGRTALVDTLASLFVLLQKVIAPITNAFNDIFPPATGEMLFNLTKRFQDFVETLQITANVNNDLRNTFRGVFAIFSILWQIVKAAGTALFDLFGVASGGVGSILDITGSIGKFLVGLDAALKNGNGLAKFFEGLGSILRVPIEMLKSIIGFLGTFVAGINGIDTAGFDGAMGTVTSRFEILVKIGDALYGLWLGFINVLKEVWAFFSPFVDQMVQAFEDIGGAIGESFKTADFSTVLDTINTGFFGALIVLINKFLKNGFKIDIGGGFLGSIKSMFGAVTDTLGAMQAKLKADVLIRIAAALAIMTVSIIALSMVDPARLTAALSAITVMFGQLIGSLALFEKATTGLATAKMVAISAAFILLSIAAVVLSIAVARLAKLDWNQLARGLTGVAVILGAMIGFAKAFSGDKTLVPTLAGLGVAMILIATGVKILADAVIALVVLDWNELARGLTGIVALLGAIAGAAKLLSYSKANLVAAGVGIVGVAIGMRILASALVAVAGLTWEQMLLGVWGLTAALAAIVGALALMPKTALLSAPAIFIVSAALVLLAGALLIMSNISWDAIGRIAVLLGTTLLIIAVAVTGMMAALPGAAALAIVSVALVVLASAFLILSQLSWDDIARVSVVLVAALGAIAITVTMMMAALPGALALVIISAALVILAGVLMTLSTLSWEKLGIALAALAGVLLVIGLAGIALTPAIIPLLGLGLAITLIGIGAMAAGVGLMAFAAGLVLFAGAGSAGIAVMVAGVKAFAGLIPMILTQVGMGIVALAVVIGEAAPQLVGALIKVLLALVQGIVELIPPVVEAIVLLVTELVEALVVLIPLLVDAGLRMLVGILEGISNNISQVIDIGAQIIVKFLNGIANNIGSVIEAAANLVIKFIDGVGEAIQNNSAKFVAAGSKLFRAIVDGVSKAIERGGSDLRWAGERIGNALLEGAKNALGINSPSKEFYKLGGFATEGLSNGLIETKKSVIKASESVGEEAVSALKKSMVGAYRAIDASMDTTPTIRPVLDLSAIKKDGRLISSMLDTPVLSLDRTQDRASTIAMEKQTQFENQALAEAMAADQPTENITFIQNNNSPKALSAAEVYRQTSNQLSVVKGAVKPNAKQT